MKCPLSGHFCFRETFFFIFTFFIQTEMKIRTDLMNTVIAVSTIFLCVLFGAIMAIGLKKDPGDDK